MELKIKVMMKMVETNTILSIKKNNYYYQNIPQIAAY